MQITNDFCDAGVLVGVGYGTYSVPRGMDYDACKRVWYSLQLFDVDIRYKIIIYATIALATDMAVSWSRCFVNAFEFAS